MRRWRLREWLRSIFHPTPEETLTRDLKRLTEYRQRFPEDAQAFILTMQRRLKGQWPIAPAGLARIHELLAELQGLLAP